MKWMRCSTFAFRAAAVAFRESSPLARLRSFFRKKALVGGFDVADVALGVAAPLEADEVHAPCARGIPIHDRERRHVLDDFRASSDDGVLPDADELVHGGQSGDDGVILDRHVPGDAGRVREDDAGPRSGSHARCENCSRGTDCASRCVSAAPRKSPGGRWCSRGRHCHRPLPEPSAPLCIWRSWVFPPITAKGKNSLFFPKTEAPSITTCECSTQPSPSVTSRPTAQHGPARTFFPSSAFGEMMAVGSIRRRLSGRANPP